MGLDGWREGEEATCVALMHIRGICGRGLALVGVVCSPDSVLLNLSAGQVCTSAKCHNVMAPHS